MFYENVKRAPPDPIFSIASAFSKDTREKKVDLSVGIFKTEDLKSPVMEAVQIASKQVAEKETSATYLPMEGLHSFFSLTSELVLGKDLYQKQKKRLWGGQSVGATGALRVLAKFLQNEVNKSIYVSEPTWANHRHIFEEADLQVHTYPYYSKEKKGLDFEKMYAFLTKIPEKSIVVLQASCHNPTGSDLSIDEWQSLSKLFLKRKLFPFFDLAYQGLGSGLDEDAMSVRIFAKEGHEMVVTVTYSKNFSLYQQRTGAFLVFINDEKQKKCVASQIKKVIRGIYSSPPSHGALIVQKVLSSSSLKELWLKELSQMKHRVNHMRKELAQYLCKANDEFTFLNERRGMFSLCNLTKEQVQKLMDEFAVYMPYSGRINFCGLNHKNIKYVTDAILSVSKG